LVSLLVLARPALVARVRAMIVGRPATLVITMATPVPLTTVHLAVQHVPVLIGVGDGATTAPVNGSHVLAWVSVARDTEFAEIASVPTVVSNVPA
jgi:hypothetical protein